MFLSYAAEDVAEVELLDLELRRRGVPLWRDHSDLQRGRPVEKEIVGAIDLASGYIVYLTPAATGSKWVREIELGAAIEKQRRDPGMTLIPIFRGSVSGLVNALAAEGTSADRDRYTLDRFAGTVIRDEDFRRDHRRALRKAADDVLSAYLDAIAGRGARNGPLRIGIVTRGGPGLMAQDLDLRLDWSADYPADRGGSREPPSEADYRESLEPALESIKQRLVEQLPGRPLRVVPQCHLTMALAFGFRFRRNTHIGLEVEVPGPGDAPERWLGPPVPRPASTTAWSFAERPGTGQGGGLAVAVNVSQPRASFEDDVRRSLDAGAGARALLYAEPASGPSKVVLAGLADDEPHRMAVALVEAIERHTAYAAADVIHLFYAGPAGLAILLGQALSNVRPVQTYEWLASRGLYQACFELASS